MNKIHKGKIEEVERDRSNRIEDAKKIIEKKLRDEEKNRRLVEEQERKELSRRSKKNYKLMK